MRRPLMRTLPALLLVAALAGCASIDPASIDPASIDPYESEPIARHLQRDDDVGYCARLFADIDRRIDTLERRDAEARRIPGFPYLRVDRLTAALVARAVDAPSDAAWRARLAALDEDGRRVELANAALPADDVARCRALLGAADAGQERPLRERAVVPDDYNDALRALGLYPLTRLVFAWGIGRWHHDTRAEFALPLAQLPVRGRLVRYAPPEGDDAVMLPTPRDALGIAQLSGSDRSALLARHAPVLEIDVAGDADRPGAVVLDDDAQPIVDIATPAAYTRMTYAIVGGRPVLQLVYTFWFRERPSRSQLDLLAGRLDGLIWRVTLDAAGTPMIYDSIHACGCYHLFFPTDAVAARPRDDGLNEGLFAPQRVHALGPRERIVLRLESGTHYIQRVGVDSRRDGATPLRFEDERRLASLPLRAGGTRSAYRSDGLMAGSERAERFLFWPMGIESAGQMRQWGRHATAFVGRRHFDDPRLLDSYFIVVSGQSVAP